MLVPCRCLPLAALALLRHPLHAHERVTAAPQHEFLQIANLLEVPFLCCFENPLSQAPYVSLSAGPVDAVPVQWFVLWSVHFGGAAGSRDCLSHVPPSCPTCPAGSGVITRDDSKAHLAHMGTLSGQVMSTCIRRVISWIEGLQGFPLTFRSTGVRFLGHPVPTGELGFPCGWLTGLSPDSNGVSTFHTRKLQLGWVPPLSRNRRCPPPDLKSSGVAWRISTPGSVATDCKPSGGFNLTRHQRGFTRFTRPVFPSPVVPRWPGNPWA